MHDTLEDEVKRILASMESEEPNGQEQDIPGTSEQETQPDETIHIHYFPDAIVILKEDKDSPQTDNAVETTLAQAKKPPVFIAYAICVFYLLLILSCIAYQVYEILNPPIATITIVPITQTVTLTGTLQLGRVLSPLTISQSQTVPTSGKGHQDAKAATGFITFYNGQLNSVTVPAGTILTASNGVQVITEQGALIPAASPPTEGQAAITAHAATSGTRGNISAKDLNEACCALSVLAVNLTSFTGGQDERDFQTVARSDIDTTATPLKTAVAQSMQGAFQGQLTPDEQLQILPCTPTVTSDHQPGQEATRVKVTVSETCSSVAYNREALERKATDLLTHQAATQVGASYSLFGAAQVSVIQATTTPAPHILAFLSVHAQGTWMYALSHTAQQHIKSLIAGKTKQQALDTLAHLPGIQQATIGGLDVTTRLPKNPAWIHLVILEQLG
jgi:hypothetical protein